MVQNCVFVGRVFAVFTGLRDRGSVGARVDENSADVFSIDLSSVAEVKRHFLVKRVDENVEKLDLVNFTVCLLPFARPIRSK